MAAKIIVHAPGRLQAVRRMRMALGETIIEGVETNLDFQLLILFHPDYLSGRYDTSFVDENAQALLDWDSRAKSRKMDNP
jgi:acetyl-CoA carboxylase biotin carboxylase subunit